MAVNILEIDPKNFSFEFGRDWATFRDSRVKKFLVVYLEKEIYELHLALENTAQEETRRLQGALKEARKILSLIDRPFSDDATMKDILAFLQK